MGKGKEIQLVKVSPAEYGVEAKDAQNVSEAFKPMLDKMVEMEGEYNQVVGEFKEKGITPEVMGKAKNLRQRYVKVRTTVAKIHKSQKERALNFGKYIDGWKNAQLAASSGKEEQLAEIEKHFENIEKERIAKLQEERSAQMEMYEAPHIPENLGTMEETVWVHFIASVKKSYDDQKAAEVKAEEEREKKAEEDRLENERIRAENDKLLKVQEKKRKDEEREKKKIEKLQQSREAQLINFTELIPSVLGTMSENEFGDYLKSTKESHEKREREKKAEADREERESKLQIKRSSELQKYEVESIPSFLGAMEEEAWKDCLENAKVNLKSRKDTEALEKKATEDRDEREKLEREKKEREDRKAEEEQAELNKGDAEKVTDLINDLKSIRTKYLFDSGKNRKMFADVKADITSIIVNIEN